MRESYLRVLVQEIDGIEKRSTEVPKRLREKRQK